MLTCGNATLMSFLCPLWQVMDRFLFLFSGNIEAMVPLRNGMGMSFGLAVHILGWPLGGIGTLCSHAAVG